MELEMVVEEVVRRWCEDGVDGIGDGDGGGSEEQVGMELEMVVEEQLVRRWQGGGVQVVTMVEENVEDVVGWYGTKK